MIKLMPATADEWDALIDRTLMYVMLGGVTFAMIAADLAMKQFELLRAVGEVWS